ncbi:MAG: prepilin-type N-terminal cleavage/methylation domain-containing protein [Gammaproteobacteria bacterium]|nr:prepilin-type N-terminal cleavage/methylation domain-containing protein [Gammaproteobacteria bacterium]
MLLALIPLREKLRLNKPNNDGFSLLEVIVALAIMAMGFVTVLQLFSGSIRSVSLSEQYLKGTTLAHSKLGELEVNNYSVTEYEGIFPDEKNYRWQLQVSPHASPLNSKEENIQLSEVTLNVLWEDAGKTRDIEISTLKVDGTTYPSSDSFLAQSFGGGPGSIKANEEEAAASAPENYQVISGVKVYYSSNICGASTTHVSGN